MTVRHSHAAGDIPGSWGPRIPGTFVREWQSDRKMISGHAPFTDEQMIASLRERAAYDPYAAAEVAVWERYYPVYGPALRRPCPKCDAWVLQPCVAAGGGERSTPHAPRVNTASIQTPAQHQEAA